ncbi:CMGC protein kinase [Helicocarpus griseus UAMH5409]|uniref:CMGC protein kinase n=1 Tax=Helicocarpus griseus UAMH5409 TaxID=1447875 RepID=A0A2B7XWR5_9EURO|nr:CMGC protein kinase [Helicocarpus griseus UAMH5409]
MVPWADGVLKGQKASYKLLKTLKEPSLYKAAVLPISAGSSKSPAIRKYVAIKDLTLERELREDWAPSLSSVKKRMVLEWMDTDLWLIQPFGKPFANPKLPAIVTKSILEALLVFQQTGGVHTETDVNPNNIFLSDLEAPTPIVKLGDLDNIFSEGVAKNNQGAQSNETRAPEVWRGLGVWHSSDIWSLGVTITHWLMSSTIFGPRDKLIQDHQTAWCLAKIFRLLGPIEPPDNPEFKNEFDLAHALEGGGFLDPNTGDPKPYISVGTLREELSKLPRELCSESCIDFLECLLVIDPAKRPTAEMALKHPFISSVTI